MNYFSDSYFESRKKFHQLVMANNGRLQSYEHPSARGPGGETLTVDAAVFGLSPAQKVFFNLNGVHGNESYSGGAGQLQWIDSGALNDLPADVAVVLVHNINPYGWAWDSQLNEEGVNLNRNFVDFDNLPESDPLHLELEHALRFGELSLAALTRAGNRVKKIAEKYGEARYWSVMMTGQYIAPRGLNYGGAKPAWSNTLLLKIASEHLAKAEKVALIDWHTGVGDYGMPWELHFWPEGSEQWNRLVQWWGEDVVRRGALGIFSGGDDQASTADIRGPGIRALVDSAPNTAFCGGVVEFGTAPLQEMSLIAVLDIWLEYDAREQGLDTRVWRTLAQFGFAPRAQDWRISVLGHTARIHKQTMDGLLQW